MVFLFIISISTTQWAEDYRTAESDWWHVQMTVIYQEQSFTIYKDIAGIKLLSGP